MEQCRHEELGSYLSQLRDYEMKLEICGPDRNSHATTDYSAKFMRFRKDHMDND